MTPQEFLALWGADDMVRLPSRADAEVLGSENMAFLREAGLPRSAGLRLDFSAIGEGLPLLADIFSNKELSAATESARYRVLGQDNASYLCIAPERSRGIVALWPKQKLERFVNTGVPQLAECLLGYREISKGSSHLDDAEYARELKQYIVRADPAALQDEESWWSVVVEQAGYGDL